MSTFRFADLRADVERLNPDPLLPDMDIYVVRISSPDRDAWVEQKMATRKKNRTVATDFDMAWGVIGGLDQAARYPDRWRKILREMTEQSDEEIESTLQVAERLAPYLTEALESGTQRFAMYQEAREGGVGPYDPSMGIARRMEMPEVIRTKEDMAMFFAYLYIVEKTAFHPDDRFSEYVDGDGNRAYTRNEAATRQRLMNQSWKVAEKNRLDIYEMALWVGSLVGAGDPENTFSAPAWLKSLSNTWL